MADFGEMLSGLFGGGSSDQGAVDPNTGLSEAQKYQTYATGLGQLGGLLMAAGQKQMPADRAKYLAQLGSIPGAMNQQTTQMMQQKLLMENTKAAQQKAASQENFMKLAASPEFQQQFAGMNPQNQAMVQAALATRDPSAILGLVQHLQPSIPAGMLANRGAGFAIDPMSGRKYDLNTGKPIEEAPSQGGASGQPIDPTKFNLPANTIVSDEFNNLGDDAYKHRLADVYAGRSTLGQASRGNNQTLMRMQQDVYRAFPDYKPEEAANRSVINKELSSTGPRTIRGLQQQVGTVIEHLAGDNGALEAAKELPNGNILKWNELGNALANQTGDPKITAFNTRLHLLQMEMGKALANGVVTVDEKKTLDSQLSAANSPAQIRAAMDGYVALLSGKAHTVDSSTQNVLGDFYNPDKHSVLLPNTRKLLDQYSSDTWGRPQQQPQQQAPTGAPAPGKYRWNPKTNSMEAM